MKKISVVIPCYNEEKSVKVMYERLSKVFRDKLNSYDYEIIFVDDRSPDATWNEIKSVCAYDQKVKGIRNARNFGFTRNVFECMKYGDGDATFMLFGDLQDPPELLPDFIAKWEEGYKVVLGQKTDSEENKVTFMLRTAYYRFIKMMSPSEQIQHYNGFGLYDKEFIDVIKSIEDPAPYLKGIISEFSMSQYIIKYKQSESLRGSSGANFFKCYDIAMLGITSYTKTLMRMATFVGVAIGLFSVLYAIFIFISKVMNWSNWAMGVPSILIGVFFIGGVQLFFTGILGEYILSINTRTMKRPLVVIGEKLNFDRK